MNWGMQWVCGMNLADLTVTTSNDFYLSSLLLSNTKLLLCSVKIIWEHIQEGKEHNFMIRDDTDHADTGYDVRSAMHYSSTGFSIDSSKKLRTIMPRDLHQLTAIGQRIRLQFNDIKRINYAYNCIEKMCKDVKLQKPCQNGGYQDPKNCNVCRCPFGTSGVDCSSVPQGRGQGMTGCGGTLWLDKCSVRTIGLPPYPEPYGEDAECTWRIKSNAKGLIFSFQEKPDLACSSADTCYDFVEIKTNMDKIASPGKLYASFPLFLFSTAFLNPFFLYQLLRMCREPRSSSKFQWK